MCIRDSSYLGAIGRKVGGALALPALWLPRPWEGVEERGRERKGCITAVAGTNTPINGTNNLIVKSASRPIAIE